jgi:Tol biopolymer transport system component
VTLLGRTADDQWFQIAFPEGSDKRGWIAAQFTTLQGNIETVAIVEAPPTPTLTPTKVVTQTVTVQATPAQPSAGKFTILYRSDNNADDDVFMLSEGVTRTTQLTTLTKTDNARLSPDGKTIIFDHVVLEAPFRKTEIFTMNADGSDPHSLSSVENVADYDPAWSPRGTQIVFVRKPRTGLPQIYTFLKDGSGETPRGTIAKTMFKPRWSPDGKFIAYAATRASGGVTPVNRSIYVLNLDDNSESLLTTPDFTTIYDTNQPIWSPDGKLIAFAARNMNEHSNWEAWVMNADGTNPHRVVKAPNPNDGFLPVAWIGARWLLAGWHGNWDVYLSNQDGADLKQLTTDSFNKVPTDMR